MKRVVFIIAVMATMSLAPVVGAKRATTYRYDMMSSSDFIARDINDRREVVGGVVFDFFPDELNSIGAIETYGANSAGTPRFVVDSAFLTGSNPAGGMYIGSRIENGVEAGTIWREGLSRWDFAPMTFPTAINDGGTVVGEEYIVAGEFWYPERMFRISDPSAAMERLADVSGVIASGLDATGNVLFTYKPARSDYQVTMWRPNGSVDVIGEGIALAMSSSGNVIVGMSNDRAVIWDANGLPVPLMGGRMSAAIDTNDSGETLIATPAGSYLRSGGRKVKVSALAQAPRGWRVLYARAINNRGDILVDLMRKDRFGQIVNAVLIKN